MRSEGAGNEVVLDSEDGEGGVGDELPGITRFKLGTGGRLVTFAGTYHR